MEEGWGAGGADARWDEEGRGGHLEIYALLFSKYYNIYALLRRSRPGLQHPARCRGLVPADRDLSLSLLPFMPYVPRPMSYAPCMPMYALRACPCSVTRFKRGTPPPLPARRAPRAMPHLYLHLTLWTYPHRAPRCACTYVQAGGTRTRRQYQDPACTCLFRPSAGPAPPQPPGSPRGQTTPRHGALDNCWTTMSLRQDHYEFGIGQNT